MSKNLEYKSESGDSYTLTFDNQKIVIECYLLGSILGGTGTDCSHTVGKENIVSFLTANELKDTHDLMKRVSSFTERDWRALHHSIIDFQTDSFVWEETDWSDSIDFTVTIDGNPETGSVLKTHVRAISNESSLAFSYQWESRATFEDRFKSIVSANESTYIIRGVDRGTYIRVRVEAREKNGLKMNSATSPDSGRIRFSY